MAQLAAQAVAPGEEAATRGDCTGVVRPARHLQGHPSCLTSFVHSLVHSGCPSIFHCTIRYFTHSYLCVCLLVQPFFHSRLHACMHACIHSFTHFHSIIHASIQTWVYVGLFIHACVLLQDRVCKILGSSLYEALVWQSGSAGTLNEPCG